MRKHPIAFTLPAALLAGVIAVGHAAAQSPAGVFAGKTVNMIIGFGTGGGYDLWARLVARHIGKHLPGNPTVSPQNMEGAGSYRAANFIYNVAPKDGTSFALIARDAPLGPLTGAPGAQFDATKLSWLGTPAIETNVCIAYNTAAVKTAQDLVEKQLVVGDTGPGTGTRSYPKALNDLLGMKFRIVGVYPSSADVFLAMERGEVQGICESLDSIKVRRPDWIPMRTVSARRRISTVSSATSRCPLTMRSSAHSLLPMPLSPTMSTPRPRISSSTACITVRSASESSRIDVNFAIAAGVATGVLSNGSPARSATNATSGGGAKPPVISTQGKSSVSATWRVRSRAAESRLSRYRISLSPKISTRPGFRYS